MTTIDWTELERRLDEAVARSRGLTDRGNAYRLLLAFGDRIRYCAAFGRWYVWDGSRWAVDDRRLMLRLGTDLAELILADPPDADATLIERWATRSQGRTTINNAVDLAGALPGIAIAPADLDADPTLLNVRNGTLRLGAWDDRFFTEPDPEHLITKQANARFDSEAVASVFHACLERWVPDPEARAFLQRCVGYAMLGEVREHAAFLLTGPTASGKSTFLETVMHVLGDYAQGAPATLVAGRAGGIPNDVARLHGARLVAVNETDEGAVLRSADFKRLTGGDRLTGRFLYQEYFDFTPSHTLFYATNFPPEADGADDAIWRRVHVIEFPNTTPEDERDPMLPELLRLEADGILLWALNGFADYLDRGLAVPAAVRARTETYRRESDPVGMFLEERCVIGPEFETPAGDLYRDYAMWEEMVRGEKPMTPAMFGRRLTARGIATRKSGMHYRVGVMLAGPPRV